MATNTWNDRKLAQNPLNLALAYFSWSRSPPVGIICDISMSIVCFYNIWSVLGCLESFRGKNWPQIAWNDWEIGPKSLKFSSCFSWLRSLPVGIICDISLSIICTYNIVFGLCGVFQKKEIAKSCFKLWKISLKPI